MSRTARIQTKLATFTAELYEESAPQAVNNFCDLARGGFYDGLIIFKVIPHVLFQTGCPQNDGTGRASHTIPCELDGEKQYHDQGVLSMAHCGRDTASSQFFVCMNRRKTEHFDGNHTCFGKIVTNIELIDNLVYGDVIQRISIS
ncbi:MAG: peptidylprolyl isomerase [Bacteroidota bacterium]